MLDADIAVARDSIHRLTPQGEIVALAGFIACELAAGNPTAIDERAFFDRADSDLAPGPGVFVEKVTLMLSPTA